MKLQTFYISKRFLSEKELNDFYQKHAYQVTEISYTSSVGEIDFSKPEEKHFLMQKGYPKILARFFA
ncbi:MAG: hypothetical protein M9887_07280 [Chitinophagales bacterium]|nr:hypothetical protein [Chitinophagales bacterium]